MASQATTGAMSGAASGAATGASVGGVYGAAAGAVIGGIGGYMSGSAADEAAEDAEDQAEYMAALAQVSARAKHADVVASKVQARHKAQGEASAMATAFLKQRANAIAGAGEAGIAGGTVTRSLADNYLQEAQAKAKGTYQINSFNESADRSLGGVNLGLAGQINQYVGPDEGAAMTAALIDVASSAISIGSQAKEDNWFK